MIRDFEEAPRKRRAFASLCVCVLVCSQVRGVTLTWLPSPSAQIAGYYLYYGTSSGNYTSKLDAGTNTSLTVTNLQDGFTYYFAASTYNSAGVESQLSNEATFIANTNPQPVLDPVPTQFVNALSNLVVTNSASEPGGGGRTFTYSLLPGAPQGMQINPSSGVAYWTPPWWDAGRSYTVTVRVADNAIPPASTTQNIVVQVGDAVLLTFNKQVVVIGQPGGATLSLFSSAPVTNVTFTLDAPVGLLTNVTVQSLAPGTWSVEQFPAGASHSTITLSTTNASALVGTNAVAQVNFVVVAGQPSSFTSLLSSSVSSLKADGTPVPACAGGGGELVLVGSRSLLEGRVLPGGEQDLCLYGPLTSNYVLQSTATPGITGSWQKVSSGTLTNLMQLFPGVNSPNASAFFRAYTY
jgi:hypothetical protein